MGNKGLHAMCHPHEDEKYVCKIDDTEDGGYNLVLHGEPRVTGIEYADGVVVMTSIDKKISRDTLEHAVLKGAAVVV